MQQAAFCIMGSQSLNRDISVCSKWLELEQIMKVGRKDLM